LSKERNLESLIGHRVLAGGTIEGTVTSVRERHPLPALVAGEEISLPPVVTIDGEIYVHPSRVEVIDKEKRIL